MIVRTLGAGSPFVWVLGHAALLEPVRAPIYLAIWVSSPASRLCPRDTQSKGNRMYTEENYRSVMTYIPLYIISCNSYVGGVGFLVSRHFACQCDLNQRYQRDPRKTYTPPQSFSLVVFVVSIVLIRFAERTTVSSRTTNQGVCIFVATRPSIHMRIFLAIKTRPIKPIFTKLNV